MVSEDDLWAMNSQGLATSSNAAEGASSSPSIPTELRVAVQSQAVLGALQRSLCIRAAELREGLREWGFARAATGRTEEVNRDMEKSQELNQKEKQEFSAERITLQADIDRDFVESTQLRVEQEQLRARIDESRSKLVEAQELVATLQARASQSRSALEDAIRMQDQEAFDLEEAEKTIQAKQVHVSNQPAEAAWR